MSRPVRLAVVQPPAPSEGIDADAIARRGLELLAHAGKQRADICCLPEYLNAMGAEPTQARARAETAGAVLEDAARICREAHMHAVVPLIEARRGELFNTAVILDRGGAVVGRYDKTHLTREERERWGLSPGDKYPVFELDFGRVGVMICYDGCFPEPARILALEGAEIIFFPSLQRGYPEDALALQVRSRAADNFVYVARSSYGTPRDCAWRPGMMVGKSCIAAPDGTLIADLGKYVGVTFADIDLDLPLLGLRSHGGEAGVLKTMRFQDRRPDTYGRLLLP